jgi:hypothetical protein
MMALYGALIALISTTCAALLGMFVAFRLPKHHLSADSKDVIKVAAALIGTLAALVLGLMTASAKSSFDAKIAALRNAGGQTIMLDRLMAEYGAETKEAREDLRALVEKRIAELWSGRAKSESEVQMAVARGLGIEPIKRRLLDLNPSSEAQRLVRARAIEVCDNIAETRWTSLLDIGRTIRWPFISILMFWIAVIFGSFGLLAPRNATVMSFMFVGALSVSSSIFLILELDQPFGGLIVVPRGPIDLVLNELGQP